MADKATELLEGVERECREKAKDEEEYRRCVQDKLKEVLNTQEAKAIAEETLKEGYSD